MHIPGKTTGVIIAAVTGAAAGTMVALVASPKKNCHHKTSSFAKTTSHILDTAGTIILKMSDMLK